jgi:predicted RNA methylase
VAEQLRARKRVQDSAFDLVYPAEIRRVSSQYWTPVDVALTAAEWLAERGCRNLLDVGAGPGKFCIVASLALGRTVTGIEQRNHLVAIGRAAAASYGASVEYVHGTIETLDASPFDAWYMYNPFGENLYDPAKQLDEEVELSALRYMHDLTIIEHWLDIAPADTHLITFHGFGGRIPSNYRLLHEVRKRDGHLRLWHKHHDGRSDRAILETDPRLARPDRVASR